MSNPPGTDRDDTDPAADAGQPQHFTEDITEEITEEITLADTGEPDDEPAERRYTAPGFDAGSTQIIDRVPDAPTEVLASTDTESDPAGQSVAPPGSDRRRPRRRKLAIVAGVTGAVILVAGVLAAVILTRVSQEDRVRSVIGTFDTAVQNGDLATLREVTCGQTQQAYADYDERAWSDAYAKISSTKQYPVVASVDDVVVNGDHAEANVTSYMAFDPGTTSTRSFDLQLRDNQWKICQAF